MTIWAEQREIVRMVVLPIAVNMLDLNGNTTGFWISFVPAAARATFAEFVDEVPPDEAIAVVHLVAAALQCEDANVELV